MEGQFSFVEDKWLFFGIVEGKVEGGNFVIFVFVKVLCIRVCVGSLGIQEEYDSFYEVFSLSGERDRIFIYSRIELYEKRFGIFGLIKCWGWGGDVVMGLEEIFCI